MEILVCPGISMWGIIRGTISTPSAMPPLSSNTRVAALVPAWHAADFIQPTLDCLSAQTHGNLQIIISVDQCDDATASICEAHARKDNRFRVVAQPKRLGYVGNCNYLLGQADADYVLFAFHDDILAPEYVADLAAVLDQRPEVVLAYSDVHLTHADGLQEHWVLTELEGVTDKLRRATIMMQGGCRWYVPNRGVFRLEPARRINGLKTHGAGDFSSDWPWLFHMSLLGEFARIPKTLCHKYYKIGSLSRRWDYSARQLYEVRAAMMREIWISDLSTEEKLALAGPLARWLINNHPDSAPEGDRHFR